MILVVHAILPDAVLFIECLLGLITFTVHKFILLAYCFLSLRRTCLKPLAYVFTYLKAIDLLTVSAIRQQLHLNKQWHWSLITLFLPNHFRLVKHPQQDSVRVLALLPTVLLVALARRFGHGS